MKNGPRWILVAIVAAGLFLTFYYFGFAFWHPYYFGAWGYRSFGPRIFPAFPFFGVLVLIVLGFILARLLFSTSRRASTSPDEQWTFCPHCGRDLRAVGKPDGMKGDENVSLPRP